MILYRFMPDGTFVTGDTVTGVAEIAHQSSFWAKQAKFQPWLVARQLLSRIQPPDQTTRRGRAVMQRNTLIIKSLIDGHTRSSHESRIPTARAVHHA